ncbi:SRPBCC family protein [Kitasatospora aureofaciens]|uniref:SRPBCC family protein n=1 Tax=Kitasatospora aureofaciens TaxID=1894 RepID=UPI001C47500F|nr:SRPBCC family protein [Kitasatospora aureofaciens]MBV6698197.1 SRPBCC family protein [Kitasatospora aureofaciens]
MSRLEEQIEIDAPAEQVWAQLHRFDEYPQFVDGVRSAFAEGDSRAHFDISLGAEPRGFDTELTDRGGEQVLEWQTRGGSPELKGTFAVRELDSKHCELQARLEYDGDEIREAFGGPKGFAQVRAVETAVRTDLEQFKEMVENR